ncbi:MAG: PD40 domain-containing protein [Phycisphaerales bacterium]|nr:MAG: PD40 domain-containing protein [Phycisphaerales bacterium]
MTRPLLILIGSAVAMFACVGLAVEDETTLFFGLRLPGSKPEIFAPGVVSSSDQVEMGCAASPDGKEFYFCRSAPSGPDIAIWVVREKDGKLSAPRVVSFSGVYRDFNPFLTPDGKHMIFYRDSFKEAKTQRGSWIVDRDGDSWGEPRYLLDEYCVSTHDFHTFYFNSEHHKAGNRDLEMRTYDKGAFSEPRYLKGSLNSEAFDAHGVISADGSLMLFDSMRPGGYDKVDMYVSFRGGDGSWSDAHNLGESINKGHRQMPSLSHDGKYIFFSSEGDIWWVSADIINQLKPPSDRSRGEK